MIDLAKGISSLLVKPDGSKRTSLNFLTKTFKGTPDCKEMEVKVAITSSKPETVLPSLAIVTKVSPTFCVPGYMPTVKYPSCPPTENLLIMAGRIGGILNRV